MTQRELIYSAIDLLKKLIATPSFSTEEDTTAETLASWFQLHHIEYQRTKNNIWAKNKYFDAAKPTLMLNSHHDTVFPNKGYTKEPFTPIIQDGKLYGLGSNDAGGALVSLLATFTYFYTHQDLAYNLIFVASAEEENSGKNGLNSMLPLLPEIDVAIVGEPTQMQLAIAEKGLIVFDAKVKGTPSHAAHDNDDNPIYKTSNVLQWFEQYQFERVSKTLGAVKMTVTQVNAGQQHNAVPSEVNLVIDVRVNELYTNEEITTILKNEAPCDELIPRSLRLNSSSIPIQHELVQAGVALGRNIYGSPTLSDQAVLSCPSLKLGPGDSKRSHTADEFIYIDEIKEGIVIYIQLLTHVLIKKISL
ncbi:M20 family metallo-hydrolase [Aquimarina rhabdastrellae]